MKKERIDQLLLKKNFFDTLEQAQRAVLAGLVKVNQELITKVGTKVDPTATIEVKRKEHPYVSRGGLKLQKAIQTFDLNLNQKTMIDIGASTGGFTDCALMHGVKRVYAVDVGYGQLAWKLRQDPRVIVMEKTNFRYLSKDRLTDGFPDFATIDVSFISIQKIFPNLKQLLEKNGEIVALIKPQFEAKRDQVEKKGIVRDPQIHHQVLRQTIQSAQEYGFFLKGLSFSPIQGGAGNIEFLAGFIHQESGFKDFSPEAIEKTVQEAHHFFDQPKRSR